VVAIVKEIVVPNSTDHPMKYGRPGLARSMRHDRVQ
jgi:hypothetical protein